MTICIATILDLLVKFKLNEVQRIRGTIWDDVSIKAHFRLKFLEFLHYLKMLRISKISH